MFLFSYKEIMSLLSFLCGWDYHFPGSVSMYASYHEIIIFTISFPKLLGQIIVIFLPNLVTISLNSLRALSFWICRFYNQHLFGWLFLLFQCTVPKVEFLYLFPPPFLVFPVLCIDVFYQIWKFLTHYFF